MIRRAFLLACFLSLAVPPPAAAQPVNRIPRIGFLCLIPCTDSPIREGLRDLGYVDGKNAIFETRSADGVADRLPALAAELVKLNVDVIVAQHGVPATEAAKRATATIPIVFTSVGDPVAFGLVSNLARPGGNITGVAFLAPEMTRKQLEFLKEAVPSLSRVTVLRNPDNPADIQLARDRQSAAQALRLKLQEIDVRTPADFERAFGAGTKDRSDAIYLSFDSVIFRYEQLIAELLAKHPLPAMAPSKALVTRGALMTYAPSFVALNRRAAVYVDKILKGAKPGDLAIEQATKFELVVNLRTAKALGLTIPQSLLLRADEVIE
jgi:putative ABC transport system substrate-binding protein